MERLLLHSCTCSSRMQRCLRRERRSERCNHRGGKWERGVLEHTTNTTNIHSPLPAQGRTSPWLAAGKSPEICSMIEEQ